MNFLKKISLLKYFFQMRLFLLIKNVLLLYQNHEIEIILKGLLIRILSNLKTHFVKKVSVSSHPWATRIK
jgi:hypothetical protein